MITPQNITLLFASLTVIALILSAAGALIVASKSAKKVRKQFNLENDNYFIIAAYTVTMLATMGSLYYSEVAGYTPCKFCWYQRILMYPQTLLYMIALAIGDTKHIAFYGIGLSSVGAFLAFYHYLLQIGVITVETCSTVGFSVSCSERFSTTFGFVTIPMMAFSAFVLTIIIWLVYLQSTQQKSFFDFKKLLNK